MRIHRHLRLSSLRPALMLTLPFGDEVESAKVEEDAVVDEVDESAAHAELRAARGIQSLASLYPSEGRCADQ